MKILSLLVGLFFCGGVHAQEQVGHGGSTVGVEVQALIDDILEQAKQKPAFETKLKTSFLEFKDQLKNLPIERSTEKLRLSNGDIVAMVNFSNPAKIFVHEATWKKIKLYHDRKALVLHEILGATDEEPSETYVLSQALLPSVSCGIRISARGFSDEALSQFKGILKAKGYAAVSVRTDYQLTNIGNLIWLEDSEKKLIWSGAWNEKSASPFSDLNLIPICGDAP